MMTEYGGPPEGGSDKAKIAWLLKNSVLHHGIHSFVHGVCRELIATIAHQELWPDDIIVYYFETPDGSKFTVHFDHERKTLEFATRAEDDPWFSMEWYNWLYGIKLKYRCACAGKTPEHVAKLVKKNLVVPYVQQRPKLIDYSRELHQEREAIKVFLDSLPRVPYNGHGAKCVVDHLRATTLFGGDVMLAGRVVVYDCPEDVLRKIVELLAKEVQGAVGIEIRGGTSDDA